MDEGHNTIRVIVAGSRTFGVMPEHYELMCHHLLPLMAQAFEDGYRVEIVSGTAKGADQMGELFASKNGLPVKRFPAEWDKFGKAAGMIRNKAMAEYGHTLVAFWDGKSRGTQNMIEVAEERGLIVVVVEFEFDIEA